MTRAISSRFALAILSIALTGGADSVYAAAPCGTNILKGSYGFRATGTIPGVGDFAAVGSLTFDGRGGITGVLTEKINGNIFRDTFTGAYSVNANCQIEDVWRFASGETSTHELLVVDEGKEFFILNTAPGNVISGTGKRSSAGEN